MYSLKNIKYTTSFLTIVVTLLLVVPHSHAFQSRSQNDPIALCKRIIDSNREMWSAQAFEAARQEYATADKATSADVLYLLLESPGLEGNNFPGITDKEQQLVSKNLLLELLRTSAESPEISSINLARATLENSLREYGIAKKIADIYLQTDELTYTQALTFLSNRHGLEKLGAAQTLLEKSQGSYKTAAKTSHSARYTREIERMAEEYPSQITFPEAESAISHTYSLLEEDNAGITDYSPYIAFRRTMHKLNSDRLEERRQFRSAIEITYPTRNTVLELPDPIEISWNTENLDPDKKIRFFLTRGKTVVQDLGIFPNSQLASGIRLQKNIGPGDDYRVVGMELSPADRNHNAKFATSAFSIKKKSQEPIADKGFAGRKINYIRELAVNGNQVNGSIWDHDQSDGDIVSLFLNGDEILSKVNLTKERTDFMLSLDPEGDNKLMLYAHNLGDLPPNTVSLEVHDRSGPERIILNSNLQTCEAVVIHVNK